jgi:hypothetical protein
LLKDTGEEHKTAEESQENVLICSKTRSLKSLLTLSLWGKEKERPSSGRESVETQINLIWMSGKPVGFAIHV